VNIHGGPHGQQGPAFNFKNQVYAARGWATLMVNFRGSTGTVRRSPMPYSPTQNGNEGQDVLYGLSAAMRRYLWIDRDRLGVEGTSYGGQLSAWLITQVNVFKAAIPTAAIINLISYNYMTYYNQYEQMEWGIFPHQGTLMDTLLQRSAIRHVANAHTPTPADAWRERQRRADPRKRSSSTSRCATWAREASWSGIRAKGTASANRSTSLSFSPCISSVGVCAFATWRSPIAGAACPSGCPDAGRCPTPSARTGC